MSNRIGKRLAALEAEANRPKRRLFVHEGTFPDTKPGAVVIIAGSHDDVMPDGWVYNPGMSPAEKFARYAAGGFTPPKPVI